MNNYKSKPGTFAVLDIGSSKIVCFIAEMDAKGEMQIKGIGHQVSKGFRAGTVVEISALEKAIVNTVNAAELMAEQSIESVWLAVNPAMLVSKTLSVELAVSRQGVSARDLAEILREARQAGREPRHEILHSFPSLYTLDGATGIQDPLGMLGQKLSCNIHVLLAGGGAVRNLAHAVVQSQLNADGYVASAHASALACLEPDEMQLGAMLVDMGGGVTTFSFFRNGSNVFTGTVPIGGGHVTSDIARGLSTSIQHAERVKTLYGSAIVTPSDDRETLEVPFVGEEEESSTQTIARSMLTRVIRPRLEELFEMIKARLDEAGIAELATKRVVLTGGASQLVGTRELASTMLGKHVRIGKPKTISGLADSTSGPGFSAAVGMLLYATQRAPQPTASKPRSDNPAEKLWGWLKEHI